jgi:hypothetical protein
VTVKGANIMADKQPVATKNLDIYGSEALPWSRVHDILKVMAQGPETPIYLGTVRPDDRPHSAGIGIVWHDGALFFSSSLAARKARNLAQNPACTISGRLPGIDVVFEGEASLLSDEETLADVARLFREGGWPCEVEGNALTAPYSAPSAGPPPWHVYRFTFHTVFGVASEEPYGATRWTFEPRA